MSLLTTRLNQLPLSQRLPRMRHYLKVPLYAARFMRGSRISLGTAINMAKDEAELKMNLLQDWADNYPKG